MRQLATKRSYSGPSNEFASNGKLPNFEFAHMLVLALERARVPPVVHSRNTLQPMRVIVVHPRSSAQLGVSGQITEGSHGPRTRVLPPAGLISNQPARFNQRTVRGEILSDARGQLYEKLGRQISPLHQLASGPFGEVMDLVPVPRANLQKAAVGGPQPAPPTETAQNQTEAEQASIKTPLEKPKQESLESVAPPSQSAGHRKLFADPGQWRVVWWGEFKEILAQQLAHPERLRDTYRLPCYVQVIETERTVSVAELATLYKSDKEHEARLYLLTEEIAEKLDLVLPLRPAPSLRRTPHVLEAHERVFRLLVANDPTIDVATLKSKQPVLSKPKENEDKAQTVGPVAGGSSLKEAIPSHFVKDWEFKCSREEAIYDLNAKPTPGSVVRNFLRRLRSGKTRNEIIKWQTLLAGRSGDEQLWVVHPPAGMLADPFVSAWANRALELAGYDSRKMFIEWQIFWRRKGL